MELVQVVKPGGNPAELMESVIIKGDLSKLTPQERGAYYIPVCPLSRQATSSYQPGQSQRKSLDDCTSPPICRRVSSALIGLDFN
jgi:hypothetical protein